jgi:coenzyme F420-reducing hydrogenase beta subunit
LKIDIVNVVRKYYYGWSKDVEIREQSSSGGVFSTLAQTIIAEEGVVCGAVYDDDFSSVIITSSKSVDLKRMRTSKYVQSNSKQGN